jgi:hypothetical protein
MIAIMDPAQSRMVEIANLLFHKLKQTEGFTYNEKILRIDIEI